MIELVTSFLILKFFLLIGGYFLSQFIFEKKINVLSFGEYGLVGITFFTYLTFIIHFVFPLSYIVNSIVFIILFVSVFLIYSFKYILQLYTNNKLFILVSLIIIIFMTIKYKPHEDYGYYHLPYIINIISEKVIFGLSNIQPQYAWNSSWLNFSAILNLPYIELKGTQLSNSLLYFFILIFLFCEIKYDKSKNTIAFYFILFLTFYTLIKFSRISAHGFDIPVNYFFLISVYYFLKIYEVENINQIKKYFSLLILFSTLSLTIKLTSFMAPFLVFFSTIYLFKKKIKFSKFLPILIFCSSFLIFWLTQQFIYSGCFTPFFEFTCLNFVEWSTPEISKIVSGATGAVNKSFNQYEGNLTKAEYAQNFNWVETWFLRHKVEFLEHLAAFIIPILVLIIFNLKKFNLSNSKILFLKEQRIIYILFITFIVIGLSVWFLKSPVIRFGIPYLYCFIFLISYIIIKKFFNVYFNKGIIFVILLCMLFNISKNINRIGKFNLNSDLFPNILKINYSTVYINDLAINYPDPKVISGQSTLCWSIPFLCHLGKGKNREITLKKNYLIIRSK